MSKLKKSILFTAIQSANGVEAIKAGEAAEVSKLKFFKSIKRKVTADNIDTAKPAFETIAYAYFDAKHKLKGRLIKAIVEGKLKEATKIGSLTIRQHKDNIRKMAVRWIKSYKHYLTTGIVDGRVAGATKKKRTTKGAVKPKAKQPDAPVLNQAPETTPLKRAIEQVSSISQLVLKGTKPSQCGEGLRQEIEIAALQLVELLNKIK